VVTTATSVDYFPGFAETTTSGVPILPSTLSPTQSASTPTAAPLPPPGYSGPSEQATPLDPTISQVARNLLIALGVMGQYHYASLLVTVMTAYRCRIAPDRWVNHFDEAIKETNFPPHHIPANFYPANF